MAKSLISLGANLDHRVATMVEVADRLHRISRDHRAVFSRVYESIAIGGPSGQGGFLNAVALIDTDQDAYEILDTLKQWEIELGRTRNIRWAPRTIDLDLLLHDQVVCHTSELTLPHPRMTFRRFVLHPCCDVAPEMVHPIAGVCLEDLLRQLNAEFNDVAVLGGAPEDREKLLKGVCERLVTHGIDLEILAGDIPLCSENMTEAHSDHKGSKNQKGDLPRWRISTDTKHPGQLLNTPHKISQTPKLLIALMEPSQIEKLHSESSDTFAGPQLVIDNSSSTEAAADDVAAAILAISHLPVPSKRSLSEGSERQHEG
ncbi:MAG: 2-amino-4-hydroxy-6-hydroxymethyldihydropteridine diphosphokinase [Pirellulales bacterium]|nr:2-amino-4-hydroxy-6-hydroxymethyldihydropteridine diphosphokinase [Pirellulales bacterium]